MNLRELKPQKSAKIIKVGGEGALRQHFLDMGVIPGATLTLMQYAPMGDPMELKIHGYELTLRLEDAEKIEIEEIDNDEISKNSKNVYVPIDHPGLGEGGIYHIKENEEQLPKNTILTFALAGNQNCGKTTLFNKLTGSNQHVGNFPGVTVDRKDGSIIDYPNTKVTDLPGIYSLSPYTNEEIVSREFILNQKPKGIINIVDASNIERNMYLTMQLIELEIPMVVALNMMDEVEGNGGYVRINEMESLLGVPVVPISASKNEGVQELIRHAVHVAEYQEKPKRQDFCDADDNKGGAVHRCLHSVMHMFEDHARTAGIPIRFAASKLIEGDRIVCDAMNLSQNEKETLEHVILQMEEESGLDRAAAIADMRYNFITRLCKDTVVKPKETKEHHRSRKIDKILTGKYTAIPSFILIMAAVFYLTFNVIGAFFQGLLEKGITSLTQITDSWLTSIQVNPRIHSLIIDGVFTGLGSVLSFLPIIVVLFFFLSLLEDSGYMARVAFIMDRMLRKIGLSGKSIVPMLIGFGCTVPAVMSARTLSSERDRKMTIALTPFMSCTAKLPVYGFIASSFFPKHAGLIMIGIYLLGIAIAILLALISKCTIFKGEPVPFVMELPNYRLPGAKNVAMLLWDKAKDFLKRAFTIIFIASIAIWFLQTFDFHLNMVTEATQNESILATLAGFISPIFKPMGYGSWQITTALISGFVAKESVVSTLSVLCGTGVGITSIISPVAAVALLVFCLLYTPCIAAIASIKRELGRKWAAVVIIFQCAVAWICSFAAYLLASFII